MLKSIGLASLGVAYRSAMAQSSSVSLGGTIDPAARQVRNGSLGRVKSEVSGSNLDEQARHSRVGRSGRWPRRRVLPRRHHSARHRFVGASAPSGQFWDRRTTANLTHAKFGEVRSGRDWVPTHLL